MDWPRTCHRSIEAEAIKASQARSAMRETRAYNIPTDPPAASERDVQSGRVTAHIHQETGHTTNTGGVRRFCPTCPSKRRMHRHELRQPRRMTRWPEVPGRLQTMTSPDTSTPKPLLIPGNAGLHRLQDGWNDVQTSEKATSAPGRACARTHPGGPDVCASSPCGSNEANAE